MTLLERVLADIHRENLPSVARRARGAGRRRTWPFKRGRRRRTLPSSAALFIEMTICGRGFEAYTNGASPQPDEHVLKRVDSLLNFKRFFFLEGVQGKRLSF